MPKPNSNKRPGETVDRRDTPRGPPGQQHDEPPYPLDRISHGEHQHRVLSQPCQPRGSTSESSRRPGRDASAYHPGQMRQRSPGRPGLFQRSHADYDYGPPPERRLNQETPLSRSLPVQGHADFAPPTAASAPYIPYPVASNRGLRPNLESSEPPSSRQGGFPSLLVDMQQDLGKLADRTLMVVDHMGIMVDGSRMQGNNMKEMLRQNSNDGSHVLSLVIEVRNRDGKRIVLRHDTIETVGSTVFELFDVQRWSLEEFADHLYKHIGAFLKDRYEISSQLGGDCPEVGSARLRLASVCRLEARWTGNPGPSATELHHHNFGCLVSLWQKRGSIDTLRVFVNVEREDGSEVRYLD